MPYKSSPSTPEASFSRLPPSLGALAIMALTLKLPLAALLAIVALVGIGTSGTQMQI